MGDKIQKARIILIGCGPHAKRVYLPALRLIQHIELALVIDLESQESSVGLALKEFSETDTWFIEPFVEAIPSNFATRLSDFMIQEGITGVIIATEPLVHRTYAEWALENGLNILIDKPISTRAHATSQLSSATGILDDYILLLEKYKDLQLKKETIFLVNSQRRFHKGFQFVGSLIREVADKTNCPVTFIQAYHCDGQWRLPNEIVTQEYHPYCFGYGKASHSGYHIFDTVYQFYNAAGLPEKVADKMEITSSFIQPNGFFAQLTQDDYQALLGEEYKEVNQWSDEELKQICLNFGELDISSIITLKKDEEAIANFSINLIHNGFAGRTWLQPGQDLYKGNGRIKHESYHIQQGPFQNIQIHAYQASDKHDEAQGSEDYLGGKNHFDIYVFRNPMIAGAENQPKVYRLNDIIEPSNKPSDSFVDMDWVKYKVVQEFADYLVGQKDKKTILSQIEDHLVPVQIMSGIYGSQILKQSNVFTSAFGLEKSYT